MTMKYFRIRIHIENLENVRLEIYDLDKVLKGEPTGRFGFNDPGVGSRLMESNQKARENRLTGPETAEFGDLLFSTLFDHRLKQKFLEIYQEAREKEYVIRMELDVDERLFPQIAALPWEFMRQPTGDLSGEIWLATAPHIVFSRRRALWSTPAPTRLNAGESLRIAIAVSTPYDLGPVRFESILKELNEKSIEEGFSISTQVKVVDKRKIDALLERKPHIFHFIGHGRMKDENNRETGQLALTDDSGRAVWIDAAAFGELFNLHTPAMVFLHACESGTLSSTRAFTGIASQLVQMKIPAVLAMQYEVSNVTAQGFALEFYRSLAKNEPVDCAAQQARRFIAHGRTGYEKRDFATPVLFMNAAEGFLFDNKPCVNPVHIMKERLAGKKNELSQPLYIRVVKFLNRMEREPQNEDDKIILELIKDFLTGKLTGREFTESWDLGFRLPGREEINYKTLAERLERGEIIPFIGSEAIRLSGGPATGIKDIIHSMADEIDYPGFDGTLPMISQYYLMNQSSKGMIIEKVKKFGNIGEEPVEIQPLYELLGGIKKPLLVISASYDTLLECAFRRGNKKYAVISHRLESPSDRSQSPSRREKSPTAEESGNLIIKYSDRQDAEPYKPDDVSGLKLLDKGYSIIYKICGCFELGPDDTVLILENDFFTFSRYFERSIPDYITSQFHRRGFMFLGYNLEQWHDRLIAHAFLEKSAGKLDFSISVWANPSLYDWAFWKFNRVDVYNIELTHFVEKLLENRSGVNNGNQ